MDADDRAVWTAWLCELLGLRWRFVLRGDGRGFNAVEVEIL